MSLRPQRRATNVQMKKANAMPVLNWLSIPFKVFSLCTSGPGPELLLFLDHSLYVLFSPPGKLTQLSCQGSLPARSLLTNKRPNSFQGISVLLK